MNRRILRYVNNVLWAFPFAFLLAIGIVNALPGIESVSRFWDLFLSYGLLLSLFAAMTLQTLRHRKKNTSESTFYLKHMGLGFLLMTIVASLLKEIFA